MGPYRAVVADPPWAESGGGKCVRGAQRHYALMKTPEIIATLKTLLIEDIGSKPLFVLAPNVHLWLWCTNNYLQDALAVMQALGIRYVNNKVWVKAEPLGAFARAGKPAAPAWKLQRPGLGQYQGGQHELLLFGVRGSLPARWKDKTTGATRPGSVIVAPRREHSRKPDEAYVHIENTSPGPYLELFARGAARPGWDIWGDEAE